MCSGLSVPDGTKASAGYITSDGTYTQKVANLQKGIDMGGLFAPVLQQKLNELQGPLVPPKPDASAILGPRITAPKVGAADLIMPFIPRT